MSRSILFIAILFVFMASPFSLAKKNINYKQLKKNTWHEVSTPNFNIVSNEKPEKISDLAIELEELRFFVSKYLGFEQFEGLPPVRFLVLKDAKSFKYLRLARNIAGVYSSKPGGFFSIAEARGLKLDSKKPTWGRHVILHEMVHHFEINQAHKLSNPYWYREGIAEYLATMMHRDGRIIFGQTNALSFRFIDMMTKGGHLTDSVDIEKLFKTTNRSLIEGVKDSDKHEVINKFYGRAFITVHYLSSKPEKRQQLTLFLRLLNQNYSVDDAFKASFNTTYEALTKQVDDYLSGQKLVARVFSSDKFNFPKIQPVIKPLEPEEALFKVTDVRLRFSAGIDGEKFSASETIAEYNKVFNSPHNTALLSARFDDELEPEKIKNMLQPLINDGLSLSDSYFLYGNALKTQAELMRKTGDANWLIKNQQSREYFRKAIGVYQFNSSAINSLAKSYLYTPFDDTTLAEGATSYEIMSVLYEHNEGIKNEALYRIALGEYKQAHFLLNRFVAIDDGDFAKAEGTWLRDALAIKNIVHLTVDTLEENRILYKDGSEYKGDIVDGKPNGRGTYITRHGANYKGAWENGLPQGNGVLTASNAITYSGNFDAGVINGKGQLINKVIEKSPQIYTGAFYRFIKHGQGSMKYRHYEYTGTWNKGFKHGVGTIKLKKNSDTKQVKWIFDAPELTLADQTRFISTDINYATFKPKYPSKGLCKKSDDIAFSTCDISKD